MKPNRSLTALLIVLGLILAVYTALPYFLSYQTKDASRFEKEIAAFESADEQNPQTAGQILFIGSSSIRRWKTLAQDMAPMRVINRGFGGSMLHHSSVFFDRIVKPYQPSAIVMYAGGNDISNLLAPRSAAMVAQDFDDFVQRVRADVGQIPVLYISIKPSTLRADFWPEMQKANQAIKDRAQTDPLVHYIDGATPLLGEDGTPSRDYLVWDGLHLNEKGYKVWTALVRAELSQLDLTGT